MTADMPLAVRSAMRRRCSRRTGIVVALSMLAQNVEDSRGGRAARSPLPGPDRVGRADASNTGRFTTVDPVLGIEQALVDPQRWNRYVYTGNNPLRRVDPDGRDWLDFASGTGMGLVDTLTAPFVLARALVTDPAATGRAVVQDARLLVYGLANPSEVIDQIGVMIAAGPNEHVALGRIAGAALSAAAIGWLRGGRGGCGGWQRRRAVGAPNSFWSTRSRRTPCRWCGIGRRGRGSADHR